MIELNKCKLVPGITSNWGDILGDITKQQDLVDYVASHGGGAAVWGSITGDINDQEDLAELLNSYALKTWVEGKGYLLPADLAGYATQDWVGQQGYLVQDDLSQYATRQWVTGRGYITSSDLSGYATEDYVTTALSDYATESWVGEQGYITSSALSGYATESWVEGQSFLTSSSLKTINEQSLVGEGDIEIGGLTPAQEEAIAPLEDPAEGVLYTMNVLSRKETDIPFKDATVSDYSGYLYNVGDKVYYFSQHLYVFDDDSLSFNYLGFFQGDQSGKPLWGDSQGRLYCGIDKVLNFEDMTIDTIDMNCTDYSYSWGYNRHTIWVGEYGIYNLNADAWKFDEDTQTFSSWTINTTNYLEYISKYGVWYDGHYVWSDGSTMYELVEYEDRLELVEVVSPYFPMVVDGNSIEMYKLRNVNGDLYYLNDYNSYELIDGAWESISVMSRYDGPFYWTYQYGHGVSYLDYLIGCEGQLNSGMFTLVKMTDGNEEKTAWQNVAQVAVDLKSDQTVKGYKRFDNIKTNSISLGSLSPNDTTTVFNLNNNTTTANSIKFNVGGGFTLNDIQIATVDKCIVNKTVIPYGGSVTDVLAYSDKSPYRYSYWTTHTGRLFYDSNYEFNGSTWSSISSVYQGPFDPNGVVKAGNSTFMVYSETAIWDDANSEFVQIVNTAPNSGWYIWPCGDGELRAAGDYKLVNNGGTWSWESDPVSGYKYGMTYYIDGHVYVLSLEDTGVYEYVESTKTYTKLGNYSRWNDYSFECCGEIFFFWNGQGVSRIDFTAVDPLDDTKYIDVMTGVPYSNNDYFYGEYNGYMYFYRDYNHLAYCYDDQYDLPAVPAIVGNYVLGATQNDGDVSYHWDSGELMKLVEREGLDLPVVDRPNTDSDPDDYNSAGYILSLSESYGTIEEDGDEIRTKYVSYISCEDSNIYRREFNYNEVDGDWELQNQSEYAPAWVGGCWDVLNVHLVSVDPDYEGRNENFPMEACVENYWDKLPFGMFEDRGDSLYFNGFCWNQELEKLGLYRVDWVEDDPENNPGEMAYWETFVPFVTEEDVPFATSVIGTPDTSTDGIYVLKATVLDGEITYEWVLEGTIIS